MRKSYLCFLFCGLMLLSVFANADIWGNRENQELSDVVFRDLSFAINIHSRIYGGRITSRLPGTVFDDEVVEMTGVLTTKLCFKGLCADAVANVSALPLLDFQKKGKNYYGAFKHMDDLQLLKRKAIRAIAYDEFLSKAKPAVPYVVQSGDFMGTLLTRYIIYDDANNDGIIGRSEIRAMRSDAFVEYCYATAGMPIMQYDITTVAGADALRNMSAENNLYPSYQRDRLDPSNVTSPSILVLNKKDNTAVNNTGVVGLWTNSLDVTVTDLNSGPQKLKIINKETNIFEDFPRPFYSSLAAGEVNKETSYIFKPDVSKLYGPIKLLAYDHAGNKSEFNFAIGDYPLLGYGRSTIPLYENFKGVSVSTPSTLERDHEFFFSDNLVGISSITISGGSGNIIDWSFNPTVQSTVAYLSGMDLGEYSIKITNSVGKQTVAPFKISTMTSVLVPEHSTQTYVYDNLLTPGTFYDTINLNFNSEDDLRIVQFINRTSSAVIESREVSGKTRILYA